MIALLVITDGRPDYLPRTIASARDQLAGDITERWLYDDSGDLEHRRALASEYPDFRVFGHKRGRQGFGGAIRAAWDHLDGRTGADFIFHLEDDFTFNRPVDLDRLGRLLMRHPRIAQVALRRQPWNVHERTAGGVVELHPDWFVDAFDDDDEWLEHVAFWTTNPSLYRRTLIRSVQWPAGRRSEGMFTQEMRARGAVFAYYGARDSGEWVTHIGEERNGVGY